MSDATTLEPEHPHASQAGMPGILAMGRGAAVGALVVTILGVGGAGIATAANGGSFTRGTRNTATKTTSVHDPDGTPAGTAR